MGLTNLQTFSADHYSQIIEMSGINSDTNTHAAVTVLKMLCISRVMST